MAVKKVIKHIGVKRRSGRYPWGSGKDGYQRTKSFLGAIKELEDQGLSPIDVAKAFGMNTRELREQKSIANASAKAAEYAMADRLKAKGYSNVAIGERLGRGESYVRTLFDADARNRALVVTNTAALLRNAVDEKGLIDIGVGTEYYLGVHNTKLRTSVAMLKNEGYEVHTIEVPQPGDPGKYTTMKVLAPPGTTKHDVYTNKADIQMVTDYTINGGRSVLGVEPVKSLSSDRILVRYKETGGANKDGTIELRPGVEDLSLGGKHYAQVRVAVDDTHFMKGMALYNPDMPAGVDVIYNTSRSKVDGNPLKPMGNPDNPFGASIRQKHYVDSNGQLQLSPINVVGYKEGAGEEGYWNTWKRNLSSQILSKQTPALARQQLDLDFAIRKEQYDEIMSLTNPTIKQLMLEDFASECDAASAHLKAAAMPRQRSQVLLPFNTLKDNEVYAPNFNDGERVVLIRHPHAGAFEIPELIVNNRNKEAIAAIGKSPEDAVGVNAKVASRMSGADFDGDAVLVIPSKPGGIKTASPLKGLETFEPHVQYKGFKGMKALSEDATQREMGIVSNLITDMTIKGASHDEIARAVRHSMVVIDAEKHKLNYKLSYTDNGIDELKARYQEGGASTIISRAKSKVRLPHREPGVYVTDPVTGKQTRMYVDPATGEKLYRETGKTYTKKDGTVVERMTKTTRMAEAKDARELSSGTVVENIYAGYANNLKSLGNTARLDALNTKSIPYNPAARKTFSDSVAKLQAELRQAYKNAPLERKALLAANATIQATLRSNPGMSKKDIKRMKAQAKAEARLRYGARKHKIVITDRDWLAIQSGAISQSSLRAILRNTDAKLLRERAMPKTKKLMSTQRVVRAKTMLSRGYTRAEIAQSLGVSVSTLDRALGGD